jgi:hypothetical protein
VVFVGYEGEPQTILEWVNNSADIDGQQIVFARDMAEQNIVLRNHYRDRAAWRITVRGIAFDVQAMP